MKSSHLRVVSSTAESNFAKGMIRPPVAKRRAQPVVSPHGVRNDDYHWLRDDTRSRADVLAYLQAENAHHAAMTAHTAGLRETLFQEMLSRLAHDDASVPAADRNYLYCTRYRAGSEYPLYTRRDSNSGATEQVVLDANALADGHDYFQVGEQTISPDETLLAYSVDTVGQRRFCIRFRDLTTGRTLPDVIDNATASIAWADDNRTVFYVEKDPITLLGVRVRRHVLGSDPAADVVVHEERDHSFYLGVARSGDGKYILIRARSTVSSELRFVSAAHPRMPPALLAPRERGLEYHADHIGHRWIVRTNWKAPNFRIMQVGDGHAGSKGRWRELVPARDRVYITGFALFRHFLVLSERHAGLPRLRVRSWRGDRDYYVGVDDVDFTINLGENRTQESNILRYEYSSLVAPASVFDLDMRSGERRLCKREEVPNYDRRNYATQRVWVTARDGEQIPVSLLYRKDFRCDGTAPLYQHAYGAYGVATDAQFSVARLSLVDRGFVYAIAHVRGGDEMGRAWYEQGRQFGKINTFNDFIDVTRWLVAHGYAAPDRVFAEGASAGGLLMGAVANMAPDEYRGIIAHVPFVDVVTTMLDERIPLTSNEFDEWGNPADVHCYEYMLSYSPYDNVCAQAYPAMLVTTALWDSQVQYFEPAKWVAKLRAHKTDRNPLLLSIDTQSGHAGKSGRYRRIRDTADAFAFVLDQLGETTLPTRHP